MNHAHVIDLCILVLFFDGNHTKKYHCLVGEKSECIDLNHRVRITWFDVVILSRERRDRVGGVSPIENHPIFGFGIMPGFNQVISNKKRLVLIRFYGSGALFLTKGPG